MTTTDDAKTQIDETVKSNDVVLYMKGSKAMPQCGFSSRVAGVLNYMGVDYKDVDVLADNDIRQGIKAYSDWPTIPQLYVKGEFVGGCDIITEMTLSGELDSLFDENGVAYDKDAADAADQVGGDLESASNSALDDYLSLGPVIHVDQGETVTVMVDRDLEIF